MVGTQAETLKGMGELECNCGTDGITGWRLQMCLRFSHSYTWQKWADFKMHTLTRKGAGLPASFATDFDRTWKRSLKEGHQKSTEELLACQTSWTISHKETNALKYHRGLSSSPADRWALCHCSFLVLLVTAELEGEINHKLNKVHLSHNFFKILLVLTKTHRALKIFTGAWTERHIWYLGQRISPWEASVPVFTCQNNTCLCWDVVVMVTLVQTKLYGD